MGSLSLGHKDVENMTILLFFSLSPVANYSCDCDSKSYKLNKLPNARVFVAAEIGSVEVLELVWLYFSSRRKRSVLKTGRR